MSYGLSCVVDLLVIKVKEALTNKLVLCGRKIEAAKSVDLATDEAIHVAILYKHFDIDSYKAPNVPISCKHTLNNLKENNW